MAPKKPTAYNDRDWAQADAAQSEPTGPVMGHVIMTVTRKEAHPIYAIEGGSVTYGAILDEHLREFYQNDDNQGSDLLDFTVELSPDAQRILRDNVRSRLY